jgi:hypothetical protein
MVTSTTRPPHPRYPCRKTPTLLPSSHCCCSQCPCHTSGVPPVAQNRQGGACQRRRIGKWILRWKASICNRNGYCDNTFFFRKTDPKPCRLCEADLQGTSRALPILVVLQAAVPHRIEQAPLGSKCTISSSTFGSEH